MLTIENAIEVFIETYAFVRNLSQPCEVLHHGSLRIIKDSPRPGVMSPREEIVAPLDVAPEEVVAQVRAYQPSPTHILDVVQRPGACLETLTTAYRHRGYDPLGREPLMVIPLPAVFPADPAHTVQRVSTQAQANRVVKNARQKLILPEHLEATSPPVRLYGIEESGKVIAWGRSVQLHPTVASVAGMSTNQAYRRRGLATAILSRLLAEDAAEGVRYSTLLASRMGYELYRHCGYRQIGLLQIFGPALRPP